LFKHDRPVVVPKRQVSEWWPGCFPSGALRSAVGRNAGCKPRANATDYRSGPTRCDDELFAAGGLAGSTRKRAGQRSARRQGNARSHRNWWRGSSGIARLLVYRCDEVAGRRPVHMQPPTHAPAHRAGKCLLTPTNSRLVHVHFGELARAPGRVADSRLSHYSGLGPWSANCGP